MTDARPDAGRVVPRLARRPRPSPCRTADVHLPRRRGLRVGDRRGAGARRRHRPRRRQRRLQQGPWRPAVRPRHRHRLLRAVGRPARARGHRRRRRPPRSACRRSCSSSPSTRTGSRRTTPRRILIVATAVWLGTYLIGPGKGRPFFLGSGLIALWFTVLELTENVFELPFDPFGVLLRHRARSRRSRPPATSSIRRRARSSTPAATSAPRAGSRRSSYDPPDPTTIGILSLGARGRVPARRSPARPRRAPRRRHPVLVRGAPVPGGRRDRAGPRPRGVRHRPAARGASAWPWRTTAPRSGGAPPAGSAAPPWPSGWRSSSATTPATSVTTGGMLYIAGGVGMVFVGHLIASAIDEPDELAAHRRRARRGRSPRVLVADRRPRRGPEGRRGADPTPRGSRHPAARPPDRRPRPRAHRFWRPRLTADRPP